MSVTSSKGCTVIEGENAINVMHMLSLKGALKLECKGMRRSRGPSAFAVVKQEYGFKGTKVEVLDQFEQHLVSLGIPVSGRTC